MKNLKQFYVLILAFLFIVPALSAQGLFKAADYAKISKDANTKIVSVQSDKNYKVSHLKDAILIDHQKLYKEGKPEGVLKPAAEVAKYLGENGISSSNAIIIYDDGDNKAAGRMYWILKYMGVADVKILQKDMDAWRAARIPLTPAPSKVTPATFAPKVNAALIVDTKWVKANLKTANVVFVDVRDPKEFSGADGKSPGHISGAVNFEWSTVNGEGGKIKSNEELNKLLKSAGISPDKTIVLYCATSVRAGLPFFVLTSLLNYPNVKVYDDALNVWSMDASNPIEK